MSLQSFGFFGFLLVVAAVYLHLPQRWQSAFLLAASWVFYALAMPSMLPVTIAIAVFTYLCGRGMTAREGARKTAFLRIGVVGLLTILAFFKYNGAFASDGGWQAVAMPLGISFYSFAAISYLIDAARGDCEVEKNFIDCALFLNFFATVTQGPICRAGALLPQFKEEHRFDAARTVRALRLMALGLFKLVAVSDVLGLLVDEVFPNYRSYGGPMLVLAAVFYTFQLILTSPATLRSHGPWVCCWGWSCPRTSRRRSLPRIFRVSGAGGTSAFRRGCRIICSCRWRGRMSPG